MTHRCPIDGCDYENDSSGSVIAHAVGKKDDAHAGLAYQEVKNMVEGAEPDTDESDASDGGGANRPAPTPGGSSERDTDDADGGMSVFDSPDYNPAVEGSTQSWPIVAGQTVEATNGDVYETDAGDRVADDGEIPLAAGQTLQTTDGDTIQTEQGDYLA